jgi:cytochrome c biogenesis protein CcmG/thiol:disulfide interchange protein DsbE
MSEITPAASPAPRRGVPLWAQIIVWVALLALLTLVAFGLRRSQQKPIKVGDTLPDFGLVFFDGYQLQGKSDVQLSALRGKVVVINFWASWCKPCEQEAAEMQAAWSSYELGGQVVFVGVDYVDTEPEARGYLKKFGITYPNGPDLGTRISQMFRITGVPETYFVDKDGKLAYAQIGPFTTEAEIHAIIDPLIKK